VCDCVLASVIQHATHIFLFTVFCRLRSARLYDIFPHYLINSMIFGGKKNYCRKTCFDFLYTISLKYFIPRRIQRDIFINLNTASYKIPVLLVIFKKKIGFSRHMDTQTDGRMGRRTEYKLIIAFHNFGNAPKIQGYARDPVTHNHHKPFYLKRHHVIQNRYCSLRSVMKQSTIRLLYHTALSDCRVLVTLKETVELTAYN
jgi:hypothetical protein